MIQQAAKILMFWCRFKAGIHMNLSEILGSLREIERGKKG